MQSQIRNYFKNGCLKKSDRIIGFLFPKLPYYLNAKRIIAFFNKHELKEKTTVKIKATISEYQYLNKQVLGLKNFLQQNLANELVAAFVHGSAATDELIPYSDLDVLVIIKNSVFADKKKLLHVAEKLKEAEKFMYEFDLLQHHGWFVLSEKELMHYDNNYFPAELFEHCKSLLTNRIVNLDISLAVNNFSQSVQLKNICSSILRKTATGICPSTMYHLKILLSEFMLLPSLYVQAKDGKAVFKKFSFQKAKVDFTDEDWRTMDEVSAIRIHWKQNNISITNEKIATRLSLFKNVSNLFRSKVPKDLKEQINYSFLKRMEAFATICMQKIKNN